MRCHQLTHARNGLWVITAMVQQEDRGVESKQQEAVQQAATEPNTSTRAQSKTLETVNNKNSTSTNTTSSSSRTLRELPPLQTRKGPASLVAEEASMELEERRRLAAEAFERNQQLLREQKQKQQDLLQVRTYA